MTYSMHRGAFSDLELEDGLGLQDDPRRGHERLGKRNGPGHPHVTRGIKGHLARLLARVTREPTLSAMGAGETSKLTEGPEMERPPERLRRDEAEERRDWVLFADLGGTLCLGVMVLSIERGDAKLPIEPGAWEDTMTELAWMLTQFLDGSFYRELPYVPEDLERVRRVRALGIQAIAGGERAPELAALADACLRSLCGGDWRQGVSRLPPCYPPPDDWDGDAECGTSGAP